jgi:Asp-tRNA(Asn)/Glu-tRNA(Gln) amidotransferase A subunit family amidase
MEATLPQLQAALATGTVTSHDLVKAYLARIDAYDQRGPALNAISVINSRSLDEAGAMDAERRAGKTRGLLHGIAIIVKDNYETVGMQTAAGSAALAGWVPPADSTIVKKLRAAGAIIIAKSNMHEFAYGITTVGSLFGATRNPYALDRNPGGSSGGTGAAVASNFAAVGMGSDTCGSIRIPASHNSLVGIRGTQGLVSRTGIIPLSSTQDIGGPLARTVTDLAIVLDVIVGYDDTDPPVRTLSDVLASGKFHKAVEMNLRNSQAIESRDTKEYLEHIVKRNALREAILKAMADNNIDALAYPAIRRRASLIGEVQAGTNCHLASNSGLPAIVVPGGFTADGFPIGVELLGRAWSEPQLIQFAYAYEQATHHRRPPGSTPALGR